MPSVVWCARFPSPCPPDLMANSTSQPPFLNHQMLPGKKEVSNLGLSSGNLLLDVSLAISH